MGIGGGQCRKYFAVEGNYRHFYYLTSDHFGEVILQLLCEPDKKAILDSILMQGLSEVWQYGIVENDAMDGDSPMLFGYTCDMPRIKRFVSGLNAHKHRGILCCFDFQEETLRQICGSSMDIQCIDFKKLEELL